MSDAPVSDVRDADRFDTLDLPAPVLETLELLCEDLSRTLGEDLVCVTLFGSAARGDYDPESSDLNVMILTKSMRLDDLEAIMEPLHAAMARTPMAPMLVEEHDLTRSTDVFPLRFLDIQRNHHVLFGEDRIGQIEIAWENLRLRVEQEIKSLLLELRTFYLYTSRRPEALAKKLKEGMGRFLASVGALIYLRDGEWWPAGKERIAEQAVASLGFDEALVTRLLDVHRGIAHPRPDEVRGLYDQFLLLAASAADLVDQLEEEDA